MRTFLGTLFGPKFGPDGNSCDGPRHSRWVLFWCRHMAPKVGYANEPLHEGLKPSLAANANSAGCTFFGWPASIFQEDHACINISDDRFKTRCMDEKKT